MMLKLLQYSLKNGRDVTLTKSNYWGMQHGKDVTPTMCKGLVDITS